MVPGVGEDWDGVVEVTELDEGDDHCGTWYLLGLFKPTSFYMMADAKVVGPGDMKGV